MSMSVIVINETMKHLFAFLSAILLLSACSKGGDGDEVIFDPDLHPVVANTGRLLSVDGSKIHIAYSYDAEGRVTYSEMFDSAFYVVKRIGEYKYESDRITITFREFKELPNGEHNFDYSADYVRDDTLFLVCGRVDSMAGGMRNSKNSFFYKFRYNERGELTYVRNDNVRRDQQGKLAEKPWYSEIITLDWQDGNVCRKTCVFPMQRDTTTSSYVYSSLTGPLVLSDPRNVLPDLEPLILTGYFGACCKNLYTRVDANDGSEQREYQLDEQGRVSLIKSNVVWDDGVTHDYAYSIQWVGDN